MQKKAAASGSSFRYVKFDKLSTSVNSNGYTNIAEIVIQLKALGTNWCRQSGVVATASSTYPTETPAMAIDGVIGTVDANRWSSNLDGSVYAYNTSTVWFLLDLGVQRSFDSIQLASYFTANQQPISFDILGSNDQANWTIIKQIRNLQYASLTLTELLT